KSVFERASSSTETLSAEERHTLKHTQRQEPQGEEQGCRISGFVQKGSTSTFLNRPSEDHAVISSATSSRNLESNLSISSGTNTNTLIIHHSVPDQSLSHQWLSGYAPVTKPLRERSLQPTGSDLATFITRVNSKFSETLTTSNSFLQSNSSGLFSTSLLDSASGNLSASSSTLKTPLLLSSHNRMASPSFSRTSSGKYCGAHTEILDIPSSYLEQSEVLKHLVSKEAKEQGKNFINGVNLSTFGHLGNISGGCSDQSASSSNSAINIFHNERGSVSGSSSQSSQHIINTLDHRDDPDIALLLNRLPPPPAYPPWQFPVILPDDDCPSSLKELVDILTHENSALKVEVDICRRKVAKLQRFELEMAKVEEQYESLVKLCERREQLERLARHKLNAEVKRLNEQNNELKEHLEILNGQNLTSHSPGAEASSEILSLKKELNKRDVIISQLVSQNKELSAIKERQEMELTAQRQTLNEQRTHIDILDSALTNAQTNVVKLEEE
ncbi:Angiomotin, partial [Armadillidium nasatum]